MGELIELSSRLHKQLDGPSGITYKVRMPGPQHRAELQKLQMSILNDKDLAGMASKTVSEAEAMQNANIRASVELQGRMWRFLFAALVVGIDSITFAAGEPAIVVADSRTDEVNVGGVPEKHINAKLVDDIAAALPADFAFIGGQLSDLCSLKADEKKPSA